MKSIIALLIPFFIFFEVSGQHTFSIVAVDTATGEVGSAGASCIDGSIIISDIHPGKGAIHTQAWYISTNQDTASKKMEEGLSPQEIINYMVSNDNGGNSSYRQYGVVDFDSTGNARSAAFTGSNANDWKGHLTGYNYAIQGNILLGPEILDSMEAGFLNTEGTLSEKLMAALQGANVAGADTRCMPDSVSSLSAFLRVAKPTETSEPYSLDLNVPELPVGMEPIDSVQRLFNFSQVANGKCDSMLADFELSQDVVYIEDSNWVKIQDQSNYAVFLYWDLGDGTTKNNSATITHQYDSAGTYQIQLIVENNNCRDTVVKTFQLKSRTGIKAGNLNNHIRLYPNLIENKATLSITPESDPGSLSLKITDLSGRVVKEITGLKEKQVINFQNLKAGMYIYSVYDGNKKMQQGKLLVR